MIAGEKYIDRVRKGKAQEKKILASLEELFGLDILKATEFEDKFLKVDGWIVNMWGLERLQVKFRETGQDILVDVYDPFYGEGGERTEIARDRIECDYYAYQIGLQIHLVRGSAIQKIVESCLKYWRSEGSPNRFSLVLVCPGGVWLKIQNDHATGKPKLLVYIPPCVIPRKDIWTKSI